MAGDNPIYALSSDVISISVPPSGSSRNDKTTRNYVNMFQTQTARDALNYSPQKEERSTLKPASDPMHSRSSGYENVQLDEETGQTGRRVTIVHCPSDVNVDKEEWDPRPDTRGYQNVNVHS